MDLEGSEKNLVPLCDMNNNGTAAQYIEFPIIQESDIGHLRTISDKALNNKQPTVVVENDSDSELSLNRNSRMHLKTASQNSFKSQISYSSAASPIYVSSESSNASSQVTYDSEEPLSNIYPKNFKWCVCAKDSRASSDSKMCDKCDQWYHLKCLAYSSEAIEQLTSPSKRTNKEFVCPVCNEDEVFINKHKITIAYRARNYSKLITLDSGTSDSSKDDKDSFKDCLCEGSDIENYQPLLAEENPPTPVQVRQNKESKMILKSGGSSILITKAKSYKKLLSAPPELGPKSRITKPGSSAPVTSKPVAKYTANSTGQPIDVRRNLQCMECKKLLKDLHHPAPKRIKHDYKEVSGNLHENWQYSVYCDDKCIREYIDSELKKSEYSDAKVIELLDSITKRRQKNFYTETVQSQDNLKKKIFDFLAVNPKYFIMDATYKAEFGLKEQKLTPSLSYKIQLDSKKTLPNVSSLKKHTYQPKLAEKMSDNNSTQSTIGSKVTPTSKPALPRTLTTPLSQTAQAAFTVSGLTPERANFKRQLIVILTDRFNNMVDKMGLEDSLDINKLAGDIETANYIYFRESKLKYKTRMIAIIMNLKSITNNTFFVNVLTGKLTPEQLPKMSREQMADEKMNNERMKQRMEDLKNAKKFSDMLNIEKSKPHIKKTSKGEMYVEGDIVNFTDTLSTINPLVSQSPVKKAASSPFKKEVSTPVKPIIQESVKDLVPTPLSEILPPIQITPSKIFETISNPEAPEPIKITAPIINKTPDVSPSYEPMHETPQSEQQPITPIKVPELITSVKSPFFSANEQPVSMNTFNLFSLEPGPSSMSPQSPEFEPESPSASDNPFLSLSQTQQFSPDALPKSHTPKSPVSCNSFKTTQQFSPDLHQINKDISPKIHTKSFWQGEIEAQDGYIISVNTEMVPGTTCPEFANQIKKASFSCQLKLNGQYPINNKHTAINFWSYLENIKEFFSAKLVFFNVNPNGAKNSKLYVPKKPEPIMMDDNDMVSLFFGHMIKNERIFEYKVPSSLRDLVGYIYVVPLKNKNINEECPRLKKKFSISMPRNKDQLVGIMIDYNTTRCFNLPADFSHFVQNEQFEKFVQLAEMDKHMRNPAAKQAALPGVKEIPTSLEAYKLKAAAKRKSSELEPLKEETLTKCAKTSNSFGSSLESDDLISSVVKPATPTAVQTYHRDPRLKESRDPRLKAKSTHPAVNENNPESKEGEPDADEIRNKNVSLDSEIQTFSAKCRLKQITAKEAAIWVNKFLSSNDINIPQKTIIISSLQFLSEAINKTSATEPKEQPKPVESSLKPKKRVSRFSDAPPPSLYSEANPSDDSSEMSPSSSFPRTTIVETKKSEAYYAISKLIMELKENGYDMSLQQNMPNLLNDILKNTSVGANRLTPNELNLIRTDHGHLFPHVIKILDANIATWLDPNNNSIPSNFKCN